MAQIFSDDPAWLQHLSPEWRAWRTSEKLRGRDPDPYIKEQLREAGELSAEEADEDGA
jgi:hypothetical protein